MTKIAHGATGGADWHQATSASVPEAVTTVAVSSPVETGSPAGAAASADAVSATVQQTVPLKTNLPTVNERRLGSFQVS